MPSHIPNDEISRHRARLLAWVHLIAILVSGLLFMATPLIMPSLSVAILVACLGTVFLAHIYKRYGNLNISGNLLVMLLFGVLMSEMMPTGGLYSDNLLWMLLIPTVAFLFTSKKYGLAWSAVTIAVVVGLFVLEVKYSTNSRQITMDFGPSYYLTSYLALFILIIAVITLFVDGNKNLLEFLNHTSEKLRSQKEELESNNTRLLEQEAALKRSNQDLELFASVASHDLKEPLRMINSYAQLLEKRLKGSLGDNEQEYLEYIKEGGIRMYTMLDDLLAYGKIGKDSSDQKPVDLHKSMLIVKNNLKLRLQESKGRITWDSMPIILGHSTHFIQLFQNLIANSLKFHREGIPPHIQIFSEQQTKQYVIQIVDNGIGIAEEDIDKVFGVFQRLNNSEQFEGSGIGLATVSRIMDGLGGSIRVDSTLGVGTTFMLSFPTDLVVTLAQAEH